MNDAILKKNIKEYYALLHQEAIVPQSIIEAIGMIKYKKNRVVISNSKLYRCFGRLYGMQRNTVDNVIFQRQCHLAMIDALNILAQRGIPVYFYNRVGKKKEGFEYSESAKERMKRGLSFPALASDYETNIKHFEELLGEKCSRSYVEKLQKIPQIIKKGNIYCHQDCVSELINVVGGHRVTTNKPNHATRKIHIYGRCGAFGYAVSDEDTLPSDIQRLVAAHDIEIVNHGLWGGDEQYILHNFFNELAGYGANDIVLFYMMHFNEYLQAIYEKLGMFYCDITEGWHRHLESRWCFYDQPGHMNAEGYVIAAKLIVYDLLQHDFKPKYSKKGKDVQLNAKNLNYYLKNHRDIFFEKKIDEYVQSIISEYPIDTEQTCGSIVMNCNPFTLGHRYLIEYASKKVDKLYVFVVEEDKSIFRFEDRLEMVKRGTSDILNVVVVPSGNFIISTLTFPEYFLKDYVKEKNFDVSQDIEIFCLKIAKPLNISIRFAGEEPLDPVTQNYNEYMSRILPKYNMKFEEVSRNRVKRTDEIINATQVRKLLNNNEVDKLINYVPETTMEIIRERYIHG